MKPRQYVSAYHVTVKASHDFDRLVWTGYFMTHEKALEEGQKAKKGFDDNDSFFGKLYVLDVYQIQIEV